MNRQLLKKYIAEYEAKFDEISAEEIYKWRAVKQFQDHWNPGADDFAGMLALSLSKTANLMAATNYYPRRMIKNIAAKEPRLVKRIFAELYDEDVDVLERIARFQKEINLLTYRLFPGKKDYQDSRAVLVYLSLQYPDIYFFYKYEMFKTFCEKLECDFTPKRGKSANIIRFLEICSLVRDEIRLNNNLVKRHTNRIGSTEYFDIELNILTQDFIYAVTAYLGVEDKLAPVIKPQLTIQQISIKPLEKTYQFKGSYVDHVAKQKRNKAIGDLGEEFVLQYEKNYCPPEYVEKIVHISQDKGDGLGYDILSVDGAGQEKFIEVKTTTGGLDRAFFITGVELERSKQDGQKYYLYRLYNLDKEKMTADFYILHGDLSQYCLNPVEFEVILKPSN